MFIRKAAIIHRVRTHLSGLEKKRSALKEQFFAMRKKFYESVQEAETVVKVAKNKLDDPAYPREGATLHEIVYIECLLCKQEQNQLSW